MIISRRTFRRIPVSGHIASNPRPERFGHDSGPEKSSRIRKSSNGRQMISAQAGRTAEGSRKTGRLFFPSAAFCGAVQATSHCNRLLPGFISGEQAAVSPAHSEIHANTLCLHVLPGRNLPLIDRLDLSPAGGTIGLTLFSSKEKAALDYFRPGHCFTATSVSKGGAQTSRRTHQIAFRIDPAQLRNRLSQRDRLDALAA